MAIDDFVDYPFKVIDKVLHCRKIPRVFRAIVFLPLVIIAAFISFPLMLVALVVFIWKDLNS